MEEKGPLAMDPLETVALDGSEKFTYVNSLLSSKEKKKLQPVIKISRYIDDISCIGVNRYNIQHQ